MTALLPVGIAVLWLLAVAALGRVTSFRTVRRRAIAVVGASGFACVLAEGLVSLGIIDATHSVLVAPGFFGVVPITICVIAGVAVGLADPLSHSRDDLRASLVVTAIAMLFVSTDRPVLLALCWGASAFVVWWRLRARAGTGLRGTPWLFALFQGTSGLLFAGAVVAGELGAGALVALGLLGAMGIREAVIPGHSWFVRFVEDAPMTLVIAFVAPQLGVYAHVSMLGQEVPTALASGVAIFGAATAVVASALGIAQRSGRRALAYLMMSQTGLVAFGLEGHSEVGFVGSLVAWQVLAVATSGFAMTYSALEARRGPLELDASSGCFARTPRMAAGFLTMGLASVGFPVTLGFVAEDLLVQGSVDEFPLLSLVLIVATALNGMNVIRSFFRLFSGRRFHDGEADLTSREAWVLSLVLVLLLTGGLWPSLITSRDRPPRERSGVVAEHAQAASPGSPSGLAIGRGREAR